MTPMEAIKELDVAYAAAKQSNAEELASALELAGGALIFLMTKLGNDFSSITTEEAEEKLGFSRILH